MSHIKAHNWVNDMEKYNYKSFNFCLDIFLNNRDEMQLNKNRIK